VGQNQGRLTASKSRPWRTSRCFNHRAHADALLGGSRTSYSFWAVSHIQEPKVTRSELNLNTSIPVSDILTRLHEEAPADHLALRWLTDHLRDRSFGLIMFLLGIVAVVPGISLFGGALLLILACEMIAGYSAPTFPRWVADRPVPTRRLGVVVRHAIRILKYVETIVRPRWSISPGATKRIVGIFVLLLCVRLLLMPFPLSNILPAILIALISLAYLEDDGILLWASLLAAVLILALDLRLIWEMVHGAG